MARFFRKKRRDKKFVIESKHDFINNHMQFRKRWLVILKSNANYFITLYRPDFFPRNYSFYSVLIRFTRLLQLHSIVWKTKLIRSNVVMHRVLLFNLNIYNLQVFGEHNELLTTWKIFWDNYDYCSKSYFCEFQENIFFSINM